MTGETIVWEGADDIRGDLVALDTLTLHPRNPRRGDVEEIKKSLERWGQTQQILVDADRVIVAGNHTFKAARELGWTHIAVLLNDFASPEEAVAFLLGDNKIGDRGAYERAELTALLAELEDTGKWDGTGYVPDDLAHLRSLDAAAAAPPPPEPAPGPPAAPRAADRELVLLLTDDQFATFSTHLRSLRERHGLAGVTETILRAVRDEALHLNQGAE